MIIVGLDWSRCKHDFVMMNLQGKIIQRGTIAHKTNALEELAALCGVAPVTIASGKTKRVRQRRACDHTFHQALGGKIFDIGRKMGVKIVAKVENRGGFQDFWVHFFGDVGFWVKNGGRYVNVRRMGKIDKKKVCKNA